MSFYPSLSYEELERVARDNTDPLVIELVRRWNSAEDDLVELEQKVAELEDRLEYCAAAADYKAMYLKVRDELAAEQQKVARRPLPDQFIQGLADEFCLPMDQLHDFQRVFQFAREIERQHGIK